MNSIRYRLVAGFVTLSCGQVLGAQPIYVKIDAQPLDRALYKFVEQSGLQVLFPAEDFADRLMVPPVAGSFPPEVALQHLLAGSGMRYEYVNPRTVVIRNGEESGAAASVQRAGPPRASSTAKAAADEKTIPQDDASNAANGRRDSDGALPEILIKGRRSINVDIRRTEDDIQPYVVFEREEIVRSQAADLEGFFKARLPMNTASETIGQDVSRPGIYQGRINLRGLGTNQTLVLIDGRRIPGSTAGSNFFQPNINGIPLSSIERIEVLPTTASGIYGGSATGGVINIIRKRNYSGLELQAKYGNSFDSDVGEVDLSASGGLSLEGGRTRAMFAVGHSEVNPLLATEREFGQRSRELLVANVPTSVTTSLTPPVGVAPNICSAIQFLPGINFCGGPPLVLDNGTALGASVTSAPVGYAGPTSDGGAALADNAGRYNLDLPNDGRFLLRSPVRDSVSLNFTREFGSHVGAFLDVSGDRSISDLSSIGSASSGTFLTANAPGNPFQQSILVTFQSPAMMRPGRNEYETALVTGGVIAQLPKDWAATLEGSWSRARMSFEQTSVGFISLSSAGQAQLNNVALQDLSAYPLDISPYLLPVPDSSGGPFDMIVDGAALRVAGPAMRLPAGSLSLTGLIERREEEARVAFEEIRSTTLPVILYPSRSRTMNSYYLEAHVPLIASAWNVPFARSLDMQASVRRDEYEINSVVDVPRALTREGPFPSPTYFVNDLASTDYSLGMRYAPTSDLTVRASFGTGFMPPALLDVTPRTTTIQSSPISGNNPPDPQRGNRPLSTPRTQIGLGNPNVLPEESKSWSAGLIFTPRILDRLRVSIDYTRITKSSEIFAPPLAFILQNEASFPGRVIRGPNLPSDPSGWAGPVTLIDASVINISSTRVESYDFQIDHDWTAGQFGKVSFSTIATRMRQFERQLTALDQPFDSVGYADGPLRWRGYAGLTWERGAWTAGWSATYYDAYSVVSVSPNITAAQNASQVANQGSAEIRSQTYHDAWIRFRLDSWRASPFKNTVVSLGIQNVLDQSPPTVAASNIAVIDRGYSAYGDPRLRHYTLSVQTSIMGR